MSIKRTYLCNLCRSEINPECTGKKIYGFEWRITNGKETMAIRSPAHTENHICSACLENMVELSRQVKEAK